MFYSIVGCNGAFTSISFGGRRNIAQCRLLGFRRQPPPFRFFERVDSYYGGGSDNTTPNLVDFESDRNISSTTEIGNYESID